MTTDYSTTPNVSSIERKFDAYKTSRKQSMRNCIAGSSSRLRAGLPMTFMKPNKRTKNPEMTMLFDREHINLLSKYAFTRKIFGLKDRILHVRWMLVELSFSSMTVDFMPQD